MLYRGSQIPQINFPFPRGWSVPHVKKNLGDKSTIPVFGSSIIGPARYRALYFRDTRERMSRNQHGVSSAGEPRENPGELLVYRRTLSRSSNYSERGLFYPAPPNRHGSSRDGDLEKVRKAARKRCRRGRRGRTGTAG